MIGLLSAAVGLRAGAPSSRRDLLVGGALSSFAATRPASAAGEPWDLIGAQACGMQTAFIARPGSAWYPLADEPTHSVRDIGELADTLLAMKKDRS